ncbi:chaperone for protein-folding within the ER, fungal-domain-containing protein [Massariosphaeria phaeospora]|uniref:Protein ROT1 n=1 Tax=Massariosphaeria phaeospora TaxID=100035 RepID=A0A7C8MD08_9PLEO|nr:chaperone for protein-folding within the ER, fungal-domain-containing protein [Massariosphaeria phaeospora]
MVSSIASVLLLTAALAAAQAQTAPPPIPDLIGTWSSKSNSTLTGPGFYDPVNELFKEPKHTGISYSFSADGHYEEAYYRAISNPTNPKCPKGIMQWQHGSYTKNANGSLTLAPIAVDGRQLYSDPCSYKSAVFTRYNASEILKQYAVEMDGYSHIPRLTLYKFDGTPIIPLYLAFSPPQMLPTSTLNPLTTATPGGAKATGKVRRSDLPLNHNVINKRTPQMQTADRWWWFGVFMTASGGALYYFF